MPLPSTLASTSSASLSPGFAVVREGDQIIAIDARLLDARIGERHGARRLLHRLLRPLRADHGDARGDLAVGLLGVGLDLVGRDVAGDDDDGVVRRVEAPVERQRIVAVELFDFVAASRSPAGRRDG